MTTITVASIRHNPKLSKITTADGDEFGFWSNKADKLGLVEGGTYNIEVQHWESKSGETLPIIVKAKRVTIGAQAEGRAPKREPFVSGLPDRPQHPAPAPAPSPFRTPEQMFVSEVICAYIAAGKCANPAELRDAIAAIRAAYNRNWGGPNADGTAFIHPPATSRMNGNGAAH